MAKSRKTKAKNNDFQKVKLKVGKRRPKLKEVDATFKSQKIVVRKQLKDEAMSGDPLLFNLDTSLKNIKHINDKMRGMAIRSLRIIVSDSPNILFDNMSDILNEALWCLSDLEEKVRIEFIGFFTKVVDIAKECRLKPFSDLIAAQLGCAMNHFDEKMQMDSLKVVDVILDNLPSFLQEKKVFLLENLMSLVKCTTNGKGTSVFASPEWRIKVVFRISKLVQHCCQAGNFTLQDFVSDAEILDGLGFNLYRNNSGGKQVSEDEWLKSIIAPMTDLILNVWDDIWAQKCEENTKVVGSSIKMVVCLLKSFLNMIMRADMMETYNSINHDRVLQKFFVHFPYEGIDQSENQSELNTLVVETLLLLATSEEFDAEFSWITHLNPFLHRICAQKRLSVVTLTQCLNIISTLRQRRPQAVHDCSALLEKLMQKFPEMSLQSENDKRFHSYFADHVLEPSSEANRTGVVAEKWLGFLMSSLIDGYRSKAQAEGDQSFCLKLVIKAASQRHPEILDQLQKVSFALIDLLPDLPNDALPLFAYIPQLSLKHLDVFSDLCHTQKLKLSTIQFIIDICQFRMENKKFLDVDQYANFLLSLSLRFSSRSVGKLKNRESWKYQERLSHIAGCAYFQVPLSSHLSTLLQYLCETANNSCHKFGLGKFSALIMFAEIMVRSESEVVLLKCYASPIVEVIWDLLVHIEKYPCQEEVARYCATLFALDENLWNLCLQKIVNEIHGSEKKILEKFCFIVKLIKLEKALRIKSKVRSLRKMLTLIKSSTSGYNQALWYEMDFYLQHVAVVDN